MYLLFSYLYTIVNKQMNYLFNNNNKILFILIVTNALVQLLCVL